MAMSSFEAETYAAVDAGNEAIHLSRLLLSMNESSSAPVLLLGDNKPSVTVHHNLEDAKRGKALDQACIVNEQFPTQLDPLVVIGNAR